MNCSEFGQLIDSYIKDELLVETNHDMMSHSATCGVCTERLNERKRLYLQLRGALMSADGARIDPVFADRLTDDLRQHALSRPAFSRLFFRAPAFGLITLLAGFLLVFGIAFAVYDLAIDRDGRNLRIVSAVRSAWLDLASAAVGDHENCAVKFNLAEIPISLDEAAAKYDTYYKDLDKLLTRELVEKGRSGIEFVEAHSCVYDGRRFAHVVFKKQGKLISVLVTESDLPADNELIQGTTAGIALPHHAVFVVTELGTRESAVIAGEIETALRSHAKA